jgi:tetratricopeptide (TPR) repeat protein
MPPTSLCIVARYMSRSYERARIAHVLSVMLVSIAVLGCTEIDGHKRTRAGNRLFRDSQFIDAAAQYQIALTEIDDPIIHYNLGLAYSKIAKPGYDASILLATKDEPICTALPNTKPVDTGACVKEGDRHYAECGSKKTAPIEAAIAKLESDLKGVTEADKDKKTDLTSQLRDKQEELGRYTCASSFKCVETTYCTLTSPELADLAAQHFQVWIKAQPGDDEIKKQVIEARAAFEAATKADNKSEIIVTQKRVDDLLVKDQTRKLMSLLWMDSEQYPKAIAYWEGLLVDRPNDPEIIGQLAGINLKAGNWRKSIEWYNKIAAITTDANSKVAQYQFIGNVAWAKLNSRSLIGPEAIELADRGIGALQHASEIQPNNSRVVSLQGALFNFRSTAHGASWAAAIDRASAQDQAAAARVLSEQAKKAAGTPAAPAPGSPTPPSDPAPAGSAPKSGG